MQTSFEEFLDFVSRLEPLRRSIDYLRADAKIVLIGDPDRFGAARKLVEDLGFPVIGSFAIARGGDNSQLKLSSCFRESGVAFVFCHAPSKIWFDGIPEAFSECFYLVMPGDRHTKMGFDANILKRSGSDLVMLYDLLADAASKECLLRVVRARVEGNASFLRPASFRQYDHPIVHAGVGDIVMDCGAYIGDSTEIFSKAAGSTGKVFAIEPDASSYSLLCNAISRNVLSNVIPLHCATWNRLSIINVSGSLASAAVNEERKGVAVLATTIDQIIADYKLPRVDLIKMDIEGAELNSLSGARLAIVKYKPRLMISVYHKRDDLFEIAKKILDFRPDYKCFLSHHNYYHTETVLYCI